MSFFFIGGYCNPPPSLPHPIPDDVIETHDVHRFPSTTVMHESPSGLYPHVKTKLGQESEIAAEPLTILHDCGEGKKKTLHNNAYTASLSFGQGQQCSNSLLFLNGAASKATERQDSQCIHKCILQ